MKTKALIAAVGTAFMVSTGWAQQAGPESSMPVLTGNLWQQMSEGEKMAFVWGVAHMVEFERAARAGVTRMREKTLIPHVEHSLEQKSFRQVVDRLNRYYRTETGRQDRPVMNVLIAEAN